MEEKVRQKMIMQIEEMMEEMEVDVAELYTASLRSFESIGVIPIVIYEGWSLKEECSTNAEPLFNRLMQHSLFLNKKDGGIQGTIKDGGILCSCSRCKGGKVLTDYELERHACSAQKHASNNIYLENGNNLRDVLDACRGVPMDHTRWLALRGKTASTLESRSLSETTQEKRQSLLERAINIFHEQFSPIIDAKTGRDFIPAMVRGEKIWNQDFSGMYTAVSTINSSVVPAGILRVFGGTIAELPLVATSTESEGCGYFQLLFACLPTLFGFLNVKHTVLLSADELKAIWTDKFGFTPVPADQRAEYKKNSQMMGFTGTSPCENHPFNSESLLNRLILIIPIVG